MKRLLVLPLILCLLLIGTTGALGAVHNPESGFSTWAFTAPFYIFSAFQGVFMSDGSDTWYKVAPESKFKAYTASADTMAFYGAEFTLNDQTFVTLNSTSMDGPPIDMMEFKGSYLFDFGLFVGLDYVSVDGSPGLDPGYVLSPGYRFNFGDESYVALSIDYMILSDIDFEEIVGYDIDFVYTFDGGRFFAQYYLSTDESVFDGEAGFDLGATYQAGDELVIGFYYWAIEDTDQYHAGLTWTPDFMTFDLMIGSVMDEGFYALSGIQCC
jgi:hypothetical protein